MREKFNLKQDTGMQYASNAKRTARRGSPGRSDVASKIDFAAAALN